MFRENITYNTFFGFIEILEDGNDRELLNKETLVERECHISLSHIVSIHEWVDDDGAISESCFGIETVTRKHCIKGRMENFLLELTKLK